MRQAGYWRAYTAITSLQEKRYEKCAVCRLARNGRLCSHATHGERDFDAIRPVSFYPPQFGQAASRRHTTGTLQDTL